ncbi:MAG: hypothetical protein U1E43_01335, partial [Rhodospirillales bacterium]
GFGGQKPHLHLDASFPAMRATCPIRRMDTPSWGRATDTLHPPACDPAEHTATASRLRLLVAWETPKGMKVLRQFEFLMQYRHGG